MPLGHGLKEASAKHLSSQQSALSTQPWDIVVMIGEGAHKNMPMTTKMLHG